jgi:hypothetical protein
MFFSRKYKLRVPEPCHEDWGKMTPVDKGRFCASCAKCVTDFTVLSEKEIREAIQSNIGGMCGRFRQDQLEKVYTVKPELQLSAQRRFFQYLLSAFMGLFGIHKASGQDTLKTVQNDSLKTLAAADTALADTIALAKADTAAVQPDSLKSDSLKVVISYEWPEVIRYNPEIVTVIVTSGCIVFEPQKIEFPSFPILVIDSFRRIFRSGKEELPVMVQNSGMIPEEEKTIIAMNRVPLPERKEPEKKTLSTEAILPEELKRKKES